MKTMSIKNKILTLSIIIPFFIQSCFFITLDSGVLGDGIYEDENQFSTPSNTSSKNNDYYKKSFENQASEYKAKVNGLKNENLQEIEEESDKKVVNNIYVYNTSPYDYTFSNWDSPFYWGPTWATNWGWRGNWGWGRNWRWRNRWDTFAFNGWGYNYYGFHDPFFSNYFPPYYYNDFIPVYRNNKRYSYTKSRRGAKRRNSGSATYNTNAVKDSYSSNKTYQSENNKRSNVRRQRSGSSQNNSKPSYNTNSNKTKTYNSSSNRATKKVNVRRKRGN